jgi:hypothetical protein
MQARWLFTLLVLFAASCYSKQDEGDALTAAAKIHSQLQNGDFVTVYKEAGPGLRQAIDETSFVVAMGHLYKDKGALRKITPVAYQRGVDSRSGQNHTLLFDLEFERLRARERLVFTRAQSQEMELWDLVMDRMP